MTSPARHSLPTVGNGTVHTDDRFRAAMAQDFGHVVRREPRAVVRPGSVDDVVATVRWAAERGVPVAARGTGHAQNGQAQVHDGVVLDMTTLSGVHSVAPDRAVVDAGTRWSTLLATTLPRGLTPPVLTDFLETTVGGTISAGGVGGMSHRYGAQTDNVLELDVVTGDGQLLTCSPTRDRDLFDLVRAGLGQYGVIVRATVALMPAAPSVRCYRLPYQDLLPFTADLRRLVDEGSFHYVEGFAKITETGGRGFVIEAAAYTAEPAALDGTHLPAGLGHLADGATVEDVAYAVFLDRIAPAVAALRAAREWEWPHPWLNVFLPDSAADDIIGQVLAELTPDDMTSFGRVLTYPLRTAAMTTPLLRLPDERLTFLLALLLTAPPGTPGALDRTAARNQRLYHQVRAAGGFLYPVGPPALTPAGWAEHHGPEWTAVLAAKRRHDPKGILAPGVGLLGAAR